MRARQRTTPHNRVQDRVGALAAFTVLAVTLSLLATPAIASPVVAEVKATLQAAALPALPSAPAAKVKPVIPAHSLDGLAEVAPLPSELDALNRPTKPSAFDPARSTPVDADTTPTQRV